MPSPSLTTTLRGGVMSALLLGAVAVAALPLAVGIVVGALVPEVGQLRTEDGAWRLLHLLWVYPGVFVLATISEGVAKHVAGAPPRGAGAVVEAVVLWAGLTLMFGVFFHHPASAAIGAGTGLLATWPFTRALERAAERADEARAGSTAP